MSWCVILAAYAILLSCRDNWARVTSPNKNVKVYIGAPASSTASGSGFVAIDTLKSISVQMRKSFPSFGGVMLWDASQAYGTFVSYFMVPNLIFDLS